MEDKSILKKRILLVIRLLVLCAGIALCIPVTRFFISLAGEEISGRHVVCIALICTCLTVIIFLAVLAAFKVLIGRPYRLAISVIVISIAVCLASAAMILTSEPPADAESIETAAPRPTVTPPEVVIENNEREYTNPESGSVFYKKYADNNANLTIDNASSSDLYIKLRTKEAMTVLTFYVRSNDTAYVHVPTGTYEYVCAVGKKWEGTEECFGENTKFKKSKEFRLYRWGGDYSISLSKSLSELLEVSRREFEK